MSATLIPDALPGEDLLGIEPELRQQVDPGWLHRLNLFSGRTLTSPALQSEQLYRAGRLAILGQCVTQGTVKGLELSADLTASEPAFQVAPGYGISATGEDVALLRPLQTKLKNLQVIDPQTGDVLATFPGYANDPSHNNYAGVLLLQPVTGQVSGASIDTGTAPLIVSGNLAASCDQDPQEYAFEDWQTVDGVRLVLVAWPPSPTTLMLPSVTPAASWRNRLAYTIFNAEMQLGPEDRLPWDMLGVPVALVGFDSGWNPQFVDRAAVVRAGGLPRRRYVLPADPAAPGPLLVQPALAQARVSQLSEQIGPLTLTSLVPSFAFLPPCGLLPAQAIDFEHHVAPWFPTNWTIQVGPIHQEEIETALLAGMTAMPLDVTQSESVEVLVPLPDALYDPRILLTEIVDPAFRQAVDSATQERAGVLQHRKAIQQEANAQSQALTGNQQALPYDLDAGLTSKEIDDRDAQLYSPTDSETFGTTAFSIVSPGLEQVDYFSNDIQSLLDAAGNAPYTIANDGNGKPLASPLPLFSPDDLNDMAQNGLQHFIDRINAKVSRANDLLDLAFLTAQADIYRFRQFILGSADATRLAVSPIVANIATGESAAATATNLQTYLSSILPAAPAATTPTPNPAGAAPLAAATSRALSLPTTLKQNVLTTLSGPAIQAQPQAFLSATAPIASRFANLAVSQSGLSQVSTGTTGQAATTGDVLGQSALVGAQLNVRTITIAERMQTTPSQDGIFYSVGNRLSFLQLLATLEITIADIPILVDQWPPATTPAPPASTAPAPPVAAASYPTFADLKSTPAAVLQAVQSPRLNLDSDEADLFSTGIRVLEQHTTLLRAVEGRIAQYNDFLDALPHIARQHSGLPATSPDAAHPIGERSGTGTSGPGIYHVLAERRMPAGGRRQHTAGKYPVERADPGLHAAPHGSGGSRGSEPATGARQHRQSGAELPAAVRGHTTGAARDRGPAARSAGELASFDTGAAEQAGATEPVASSRRGCPGARHYATATASTNFLRGCRTGRVCHHHHWHIRRESTGVSRVPDAASRIPAGPVGQPKLDLSDTGAANRHRGRGSVVFQCSACGSRQRNLARDAADL